MRQKYKISIIQATIKHYRGPFYQKLLEHLARYEIGLKVLYSNPGCIEKRKKDSINLPAPWGEKVPRFYFLHDRILFQLPSIIDIIQSDLIIIGQVNSYLHNYPLLLLSLMGLKKVAFWGHGYNRQGNPKSLSERLKRRLVNWTSWWFAYTDGTARYLASVGVSPDRITIIENAIDTKGFRNDLKSITTNDIIEMRRQLGISEGDRVGLYCGSLYTEKRIPYLLNAARRIAAIEPRFRLLVVGGGPEVNLVKRASETNPCIVYAGPLFGHNKAKCFKLAEIFLNPGAVGLGILDSFAAELPFVTTAESLHGPEIDYLHNGVNGLIVSGEEEIFTQVVVELMRNSARLIMLQRGARESAARYTIENMANNMSKGILACLTMDIPKNDAAKYGDG